MTSGFFAHLVGSELIHALMKVPPYFRSARYLFVGRSQKIRVSLCAFVAIKKNNRYAVIESIHRPGSLGPIGGVIKYFDTAVELDQEIHFAPQYQGGLQNLDIKNDLRGYVSGHKLYSMIRWFERGKHRESAVECIDREMKEELKEIGAAFTPPLLTSRDLEPVRTILEAPRQVAGRDYRQFTIFEVYRLQETPNTAEFISQLEHLAESSDKLVFVTSDEILAGRVQRGHGNGARLGHEIGSHVEYLLRPYKGRPASPPTWF